MVLTHVCDKKYRGTGDEMGRVVKTLVNNLNQ